MASPIMMLAPAKVNLTLSITGRDEAGYHQLVSLVGFTDFCDRLTFTTDATDKSSDDITITGPFAQALAKAGGDSLLGKARALAQTIADKHNITLMPAPPIMLEKNIPLGGGLGGGSADAAAYLRFLSSDWPDAARQLLRAKSLVLGADVPACFDSQAHIMTGLGEAAHAIASIDDTAPFIVLTNPLSHADTGAVFKQFAANASAFSDMTPTTITALISQRDWQGLCAIGNDLTQAACQLYPEIRVLLDEMSRIGQDFGEDFIGHGMSGSGASCFAFLPDEKTATAYQHKLQEAGIWAVATRFF